MATQQVQDLLLGRGKSPRLDGGDGGTPCEWASGLGAVHFKWLGQGGDMQLSLRAPAPQPAFLAVLLTGVALATPPSMPQFPYL